MSKFTDAVIAAAQLSQKTWGVPASVSLAQYAIESAYGTRMPPNSFNCFGIKARDGQDFVTAKTREVVGGKSVYIQAKFRKFSSFDEAFDEHAKLLATKSIYADAMTAWKDKNDLALGIHLMARKYATDPTYAATLLSLIKGQNLAQYDHGQPVAPATPAPSPEPPKPVNWLTALIELVLNIIKALRK